MKKTLVMLTMLVFGVAVAQNETKDFSISKKKNDKGKVVEEIKVTSLKDGKKNKMTIIIDGENVIVNGKPVEKMKNEDIEQLVERTLGELEGVAPRIKLNGERFRNDFGPERIKSFKRSFNSDNNKAMLGVNSNSQNNGAELTQIIKESAAEKAGLKVGDIVLKVNEYSINEEMGLYKIIGKFKPEEKVTILYKRDGKENTTTATLDKNDDNEVIELKLNGDFNMPELREMELFNNGELGFNFPINKVKMGIKIQDVEEGDGVKLLEVEENSVAQKGGLKKDDIVTQINGEATKTVDAFKARTRSLKEGDTVKMQITRNGKVENVEIKFPKKLKTAEL